MRGSRGVVLIHVLITLIMLLIIAAAMMQTSFGRAGQVANQRRSLHARAASEQAMQEAYACLAAFNASWTSTKSTIDGGTNLCSSVFSASTNADRIRLTKTVTLGGASKNVYVDWYRTGYAGAACSPNSGASCLRVECDDCM